MDHRLVPMNYCIEAIRKPFLASAMNDLTISLYVESRTGVKRRGKINKNQEKFQEFYHIESGNSSLKSTIESLPVILARTNSIFEVMKPYPVLCSSIQRQWLISHHV